MVRLSPVPASVRPIPFAPPGSVRVGEPVRALSYALAAAGSATPQLTLTHGTVAAVNVRERFVPLPPISSLIAHQTPLGQRECRAAQSEPVEEALIVSFEAIEEAFRLRIRGHIVQE